MEPKQYQKYDNLVKSLIPTGEKNHRVSITTDRMMSDIYSRCNQKLKLLKTRFPEYPFHDFEYNPNYYKQLIQRARSQVSSSNYLTSMGTLGGGNHYTPFQFSFWTLLKRYHNAFQKSRFSIRVTLLHSVKT